jgi:hypothetical protein
MEFSHINIGSGLAVAVSTLFALTGVVEVILFIGAGPAFGMNLVDDENLAGECIHSPAHSDDHGVLFLVL